MKNSDGDDIKSNYYDDIMRYSAALSNQVLMS